MASVVGHALGAVIVWEAGKRLPGGWVPSGPVWYLLPLMVAVIPDLDIFAHKITTAAPAMAHRGPTHSLLAAALIAGAATLAASLIDSSVKWPRVFMVLFGCALIHPVLDFLMACGPPVPFLWPFSSRGWLSSVQLIPTAYYSRSVRGLLSLLRYPETWIGISLEMLSLGSLWAALLIWNRFGSAIFLALSGTGFYLTWKIFR
ncbi:MAG: metal-dependent hydrolase [Deltaproteobacteria bacterium]|nr:metal-dependent hydrolase [Deltaproteobacteria bacterium]